MRVLKLVTVLMGVLIVAATILLAVLIARRTAVRSAGGAVSLNEPAGTRLLGIAGAGPALALALQGGGPDRIVLLDPATLRPMATLTLRPSPGLPPSLPKVPDLP